MAVVDKPAVQAPSPGGATLSLRNVRTKAFQIAADLAVAALGIVLAALIRPAGPDAILGSALLLGAWAVWMGRVRLYSSRFITRRADEIRRILDAGVMAAASVGVGAFAFDLELDRFWLVAATAIGALGLTVEREVVRRRFATMRAHGKLRRRVLMIGDNSESQLLEKMFDEETWLGYDVVETIDPTRVGDPNELTTRVLQAAREADASGAVVAATRSRPDTATG